MQSLLSELRTILEHERALFGPLVALSPSTETPSAITPNSAVDGHTALAAEAAPEAEAHAVPAAEAHAVPAAEAHAVPAAEAHAAARERPEVATRPPDAPSEPGGDGIADQTNRMAENGLFDIPKPAVPRTPYERIHAMIPPGSPLLGMNTLAEVEAFVRDTELIPLDKTRTNPVFGVGNPEADLMVIGEAPGADEDAQGEPFVGRAGQLLDKILEAIGFSRSDIYIANILKSRPPNNRNPLPAEVEAHVPILYKQIALIQPKLLLCVGKISASTLLNSQASLGAMREKFHDYHGLPLLVTYHPAALLRNPQWKRPTWEDVQLLRRRYDELVKVAA